MNAVGDYELMEMIGKGGMGTVYRAFHADTGQIVAIKIMSAEHVAQETLRRRFEQECDTALRLDHPHMVRGLAYGVLENGQPYLVMEYVDGPNLSVLVHRHGRISEENVIRLAGQLAQALDAAHAANLIHRDLKPENVLVGPGGIAKITDLGLVKDLDSEGNLTQTGAWIGTITYMAPEQFGDAKYVDARTDVYGLAATLYFALTGVPPFPDKGNMTTLGKKLNNDFIPPRELLPEISEPVHAALCLGLHAKTQMRPARCGELAALLRSETLPAVTTLTVTAEPEGAERRVARRFLTRIEATCTALQSDTGRWIATVCDVSLTGVLLQTNRRYQPGSVLELQVRDDPQSDWSVFLVRVCWSRPADENWNHGCTFGRPLTEGDLNLFLKNKSTTTFLGGRP
jgi:serine/threonine protein kinase